MGLKRFNARVLFCQLGFGKQSMNLFVASSVQQYSGDTSFRFRNQMVGIMKRWRNFSVA
jgi:hypothetical protein